MTRFASHLLTALFLGGAAVSAQDAKSAVKVYEVPMEGLKIDGKLTKDDPPLAGAPIAQLNGAPHQVFHVKLQKGQSYVIELASKDFDAYLILQNALGTLRAHDDDSGGGQNSRIALSASAAGVVRLLATALDKKTGAFQLKIRLGELSENEKLAALADDLNREVVQLHQQGQLDEAIGKARNALEVRKKLYPLSAHPDGHPELAISLHNLGVLLHTTGSHEDALSYLKEALAMRRRIFPPSTFANGHAELSVSLTSLGSLLQAMGLLEESLAYQEQALAMGRKLFPASEHPEGHQSLALSLNNLANLHLAMGSYEKALMNHEQVFAMYQKLYPATKYPDGHPYLATSLNNLGAVHSMMGSFQKALIFSEDALSMRQKLYPASKYPAGHPLLAASHDSLSIVLQQVGSNANALRHSEQALAMNRKLYPALKYPNGHVELSRSLHNLAHQLQAMGFYENARLRFEEALEMDQKLYPAMTFHNGHFNLARSLENLGMLYQRIGAPEKALPYQQHAIAMYQTLGRQALAVLSEAEALAFVQARPQTLDAFLSCTLRVPATSHAAYNSIWMGKSAVSRVLVQRHAAARVAGTALAAELNELKGLRRRIDQLLQDRRMLPADRDELLTQATGKRDKLERGLAQAVPKLQQAVELDALGPDALIKLLPEDAVLIDIVRYTRIEFDRAKPGKASETRTPSYAAFVVGRRVANGDIPRAHNSGSPTGIKRIELGAAKSIDREVVDWRLAIEARTDSRAAKQLHDLVWTKIAPHLPTGTKILYFAPDGNLARAPWVALPVGMERVLLEDYVIATVPHGPFLLEHLKYSRSYVGPETTLVVGNVTYGSDMWPPLPGTLTEINAVASLARGPRETVHKTDATPQRLVELLSKARYAHLATHGEFRAKEFTVEQQRAQLAMQTRRFGDETQRGAAKNPLGYVGLVLSGGEIISGLSILDLELENLKLVTLSACETGLGEYTAGEGVQGLQRAFHVAGCPNVVASLWKVNDAATAALMTKFYHELWMNKKPPIEALREAQLTIYRHPELIPDLAGERGAPRLKEAVAAKVSEPGASAAGVRRADTKLWAAFVLSGVGK